MLVIYDKENEKVINNMGTNSNYPKGNFPNLKELENNKIYLKCDDNSEIADKIMTAYDYDLEYNNQNVITNVIVNKTLKEYKEKNKPTPTDAERINELESTIADLIGGAV
jgi:hypothetical protein